MSRIKSFLYVLAAKIGSTAMPLLGKSIHYSFANSTAIFFSFASLTRILNQTSQSLQHVSYNFNNTYVKLKARGWARSIPWVNYLWHAGWYLISNTVGLPVNCRQCHNLASTTMHCDSGNVIRLHGKTLALRKKLKHWNNVCSVSRSYVLLFYLLLKFGKRCPEKATHCNWLRSGLEGVSGEAWESDTRVIRKVKKGSVLLCSSFGYGSQ